MTSVSLNSIEDVCVENGSNVQCQRCGYVCRVFKVCVFEHDGSRITRCRGVETAPKYCPVCGKKMVESMSSYNLPDGCDLGDPYAPWNQSDGHEGHICEECARCEDCVLSDNSVISICIAADPIEHIDPKQPAQDCFEAI